MKKPKILLLVAFLMGSLLVGKEALAQPMVSVSFQTFYNELSPYGRWTSHPQYGSIWTPYVDRDFQPYATNGHWIMTEYGNTWVSDYDWGWAPFHYGRWFYDDFYGWAPLWPGVRVGISFNIPVNFWVFVPQRYIYRPRIFGYCLPRTRIVNVYNHTTIINNYYRTDNRVYSYGPRHSEIERVTRSSVPVYRADEVRGNRYASVRQNADGTYRADGNSASGLYRQDRNESGISNRSSRQAETSGDARSNRSYEAAPSNRSRGSYEAGQSGRTYESTAPSSRQRAYESAEPSSRSRSYESNEPSGRYNLPESRSEMEPSSRSRSYESGSSGNSGRYSTPESRPSYEAPSSRSRSYEPRSNGNARSSAEFNSGSRSRSSAEQAPSRSSSTYSGRSRSEAPAARSSRGTERSSAPAPSGSSSERSSSNRSRGPR